jgi:cyclopropane fatty-acyl-phospholipid synthase-like methyltransferase
MSRLQQLKRKLSNALEEWRLGIVTRGIAVASFSDDEHIYYGTNSYSTTRHVLKSLDLDSGDVFVDLGCGKGRVVCIAAQLAMQEVIGVDDDENMCAIARSNAQRMKGRRTPIRIEQVQAQNFDYTIGSVFYMFNPFGPKTLALLLGRMKEGLTLRPRPIRIVYSTPAEENLLRESGWLNEYARWSKDTHPFIDDTISFWSNTGH